MAKAKKAGKTHGWLAASFYCWFAPPWRRTSFGVSWRLCARILAPPSLPSSHIPSPRRPLHGPFSAAVATYDPLLYFVPQEAAAYREERLFRQRQRQRDLEEGPCTFRPEITARCPELVRRTAAGMRCAREFHRKQAALEAREGGRSPPPARPSWRYN